MKKVELTFLKGFKDSKDVKVSKGSKGIKALKGSKDVKVRKVGINREYFSRASRSEPEKRYIDSPHIQLGEILTRFLNVNSKEDASFLMSFCGFTDTPRLYAQFLIDEETYSEILSEKLLLNSFINDYNNIGNIYSKANRDILAKDIDEETKNNILYERYQSPSKRSLSEFLSKKTAEMRLIFKPIPMHSTLRPSRKALEKVNDLHLYDILPVYVCNDIITLVWTELAGLVMHNKEFSQCSCCKVYFIKTGAKKTCVNCGKSISRKKDDELRKSYPNEYNKRRLKNNIAKIKKRSKSDDGIMKYLDKQIDIYKDDSELVAILNKEKENFINQCKNKNNSRG